MAKTAKKTTAKRNTRTNNRTGSSRSKKVATGRRQLKWLFVVAFAIVATLLIVPSLAQSPAVKNLKTTQKAELRALRDRHEVAEDAKDDQCDAMSGNQEDVCEDELKVLKDNNEAEEDAMKARHKAALNTLKASERQSATSGGNAGQGGTSGGNNGQAGQQGGNGGAGGAGGSGSCTGSGCNGSAGSGGTGTSGSAGTSNPGTSNPGSAGRPGNNSAPASGGGSASQATSFEIVMQIRSEQPGNRCLDVTGWGTANGTPIQLWDCHDGTVQRWGLSPGPNRTFTSILSGRCLDVDAAFGGRRGSPVEIFDCHGGINQQWVINGSEIRSAWNGLCLDVTNGGSANGSRLQIWDCWGGLNQQWFGGNVY